MKLLAISDIHGNVEAVRKLRGCEGNCSMQLWWPATLAVMRQRRSWISSPRSPAQSCTSTEIGIADCPMTWSFGPTCHHLHLRSIECCGWSFAGISGLPTSWGLNPIAATLQQEVDRKHRSASRDSAEFLSAVRKANREALPLNRTALAAVIKESNAEPTRTVLVTHDQLFGIDRDFPSLSLHLFGHRHGFKMTSHRGTAFVNVSALDDPINGDSYTIIEIDGNRIAANPFRVSEAGAPRSDETCGLSPKPTICRPERSDLTERSDTVTRLRREVLRSAQDDREGLCSTWQSCGETVEAGRSAGRLGPFDLTDSACSGAAAASCRDGRPCTGSAACRAARA